MINTAITASIRGMLMIMPIINTRKNNRSNESMVYLMSREAGKANSDSEAQRKNFFCVRST
jgi:hypothetical protein